MSNQTMNLDAPLFGAGGERSLCPAGTHYATLTEVVVAPMPSYDDPTVMVDRSRFIYVTADKDPESGEPWELADFTGPNYGNPAAKLTGRLDLLFPELTPAQRQKVRGRELVGKRVVLEVVHKARQDGRMRADIVFVKPYAGKSDKAAALFGTEPVKSRAQILADEDDERDPFADN